MKFSTIILSSIASIASVNAANVPTVSAATCPLSSQNFLEDFSGGYMEVSENEYISYLYAELNSEVDVTLIGGVGGTDFFVGNNALSDCSCIPDVKPDYHVAEGATTQIKVAVKSNELLGFRIKSSEVDFDIKYKQLTSRWAPVFPMSPCPKK
ncbi:hypothetical protein CAAN1_09S01970 [[Candida] anglica]|uniref:Uncharacterized protein n=1 Tax=[Candida] anglica TaxID=148631 RepID=A0ABP0ECE1_9ASCO